jgi:putative membrane protein
MRGNSASERLMKGAAAGLAATVPMTAVMEALHRGLPARQRHPLPPRKITMRLAKKAGVRHRLDEPERLATTLAAHFGYGSAVGVLLAAVAPRGAAKAAATGAGFGLVVWAVSYLGLMPLFDLHKPATREPAGRNLLMIAAHLVWGATAGAVLDALRESGR